jgi:hypothetical protein
MVLRYAHPTVSSPGKGNGTVGAVQRGATDCGVRETAARNDAMRAEMGGGNRSKSPQWHLLVSQAKVVEEFGGAGRDRTDA